MHVLQYLSIEASSKIDAFHIVENRLEELSRCHATPHWSDWHTVGLGRWSERATDSKDAISYYRNKKQFEEKLEETISARKGEMKALLKEVNEVDAEAGFFINAAIYATTGRDKLMDAAAYKIHCIAELLLGHWNPRSCYYDLEMGTCSYEYLEDRIKNNPKKQYLVPVDFHF